MARKVSYWMMSNEEYDQTMRHIDFLEERIDNLEFLVGIEQERSSRLYDALNRPAIEESVRKHEEEFLNWCEDVAEKYDALDEDEWLEDRSEFYNGGSYDYAVRNNLPLNRNIIEEDRKIRAERCACGGIIWQEEKTEGWSEISDMPLLKKSFVLPNAASDVFNRYFNSPGGWKSKEHEKLWRSFDKMEIECGGWEEYSR